MLSLPQIAQASTAIRNAANKLDVTTSQLEAALLVWANPLPILSQSAPKIMGWTSVKDGRCHQYFAIWAARKLLSFDGPEDSRRYFMTPQQRGRFHKAVMDALAPYLATNPFESYGR